MALEAGRATASMVEDACRLCGRDATALLFTKAGYRFIRCEECGLVSIRPLPTPAEIAAHHEASYRNGAYAGFAAAEAVRAGIARHRLEHLRPLPPPGPWLDVGCSTGAFVAEAVRAGREVEGLELSAEAVAQARAKGLAVTQGAVETYTPARRYALVSAWDVVEHLPDPGAFVRRIGDWLLPGGILALTLPDIASPLARLMGRHWSYYAPPDHIHYFTPQTIRRLLESSGLEVLAVRPVSKPLTLDWATTALRQLSPALGAPVGALAALVPRRWRARPWSFPLGEMLVTARPAHA